ncbi:MAG: hypothetical protein Q8P40_16255 [Nitrospirota bacterium]|nr:hypothetical protein [Nitrospirota bacterium]
MRKIEVEIDDKECAFLDKAKACYEESYKDNPNAPSFEHFLIRLGIIGFNKYLLTGSQFSSPEEDLMWSDITHVIVNGYDQWLDATKIGEEKKLPVGMFG